MMTLGGGLHGLKDMSPGGFKPNNLPNLKVWCRHNVGVIVVGAGIDTWPDKSGNGRDLRQTTDTNRPSKESDGSALFDGVDNYLLTSAFTLNAPETVYLLGKQITWTNNDVIADGEGAVGFNMMIRQRVSSPNIYITQDGTNFSDVNSDWTLDTYAVVSFVFNGASSGIQVNKGTTTAGDAGTGNGGGLTLGSKAPGGNYSNIQIKEAIVYSGAHDADTRIQVIDYLSDVGGLGL